jgi:LuxR family maltose regulon positive regulatory protein
VPFARTKIQPPRPKPGSLIERPALESRLRDALLSMRLVLVCAAAGFGKTSVLARQLDQLPDSTAVAWVACDEDDSPLQLFECLMAALEPFDPPWRIAPEALMLELADATSSALRRRFIGEIVNALDACEVPHGVIVIDDLHRLRHPLVCEWLDALVERLPLHWTVAVSTRIEPALALARLRAQGALAEFRNDELRFDGEEVARLAANAGLTPAQAGQLFERTQGWPVGLRLALEAARHANPSAQHAHAGAQIDRHIFDFLASEVIDRLSPHLRDFLLAVSVLPELGATRCAALSGDAQAALRLEEIERAGLFVTVLTGDGERTLRLHDLFRGVLEARLLRAQPDRYTEVLRRAAATEPDARRRVLWWQRARAWPEAEAELEACAQDLVSGGNAAAVGELLDRFPAALRASSARLQMVQARARWDWDSAVDATARAAQTYALQQQDDSRMITLSYHCTALAAANRHVEARSVVHELLAEPRLEGAALARVLRASAWIELVRGDQHALAPLWRRVLQTVRQVDRLACWAECMPLGPFVGMPGLRKPLQAYVDAALSRAPEQPTPLRGMALVMRGWLRLWAGNVEDAQADAVAALDENRWLAQPPSLDAPSRSLQAVLHALRGDAARSLEGMQALIAQVDGSGVPLRTEVYGSLFVFLAMRCAAMLDEVDVLRALALRLASADLHGRSWLSEAQRAGAAAHLRALSGDLAGACAIWQGMIDDAHRSDLYGQLADTRLRLADAMRQRGEGAEAAAAVLQPLFDSVACSGEWGAALMAGPRLLGRLRGYDWRGVLPAADIDRLATWAAASTAWANGGPVAAPLAQDLRHGPLTQREFEVLERIAAGDSNKLIARAFELSPHTVKRHVANILDKLGLASRGQAAAWLRQQG